MKHVIVLAAALAFFVNGKQAEATCLNNGVCLNIKQEQDVKRITGYVILGEKKIKVSLKIIVRDNRLSREDEVYVVAYKSPPYFIWSDITPQLAEIIPNDVPQSSEFTHRVYLSELGQTVWFNYE